MLSYCLGCHFISQTIQFSMNWGNLNSNKYVCEVLQLKVISFFQGIPRAIFQQVNACPHVAKIVQDFCSAQPMQLLCCLFTRYDVYWAHVGFGWSVPHLWSTSYSFKRWTLAVHTSNVEFSSTSRHSKFVWFHATSYSNTYCSTWWLHQILISDTKFFLLWKFCHLFIPM